MKIYFENRYHNDDKLSEEFVNKIVTKNSRRFAAIAAAVSLGFMLLSLAQKQTITAIVMAGFSVFLLLMRLVLPKMILKSIKKNDAEITGGGENIFQFGDHIHTKQGKAKADLGYDMLGKFYELNTAYVFRLNKLSYLCLKKGCFTVGDWQGLKAFIMEKRPDLKL